MPSVRLSASGDHVPAHAYVYARVHAHVHAPLCVLMSMRLFRVETRRPWASVPPTVLALGPQQLCGHQSGEKQVLCFPYIPGRGIVCMPLLSLL